MKKILLMLIPLMFVGCMSNIFTNFKRDGEILYYFDNIKNIKYIRHVDSGSYRMPFILEIVEMNNKRNIVIIYKYTGNEWLFFNEIYTVGSNNYKLVDRMNSYEKETDIKYGKVTEYYRKALGKYEIDLLEKILSSRSVLVRMYGDKNVKDFKLDKEDINAMLYIIKYFKDKEK